MQGAINSSDFNFDNDGTPIPVEIPVDEATIVPPVVEASTPKRIVEPLKVEEARIESLIVEDNAVVDERVPAKEEDNEVTISLELQNIKMQGENVNSPATTKKKGDCCNNEQNLLLQQKIVDMEKVTGNLENEVIRLTNLFNSQFQNMNMLMKEVKENNVALNKKNKSIELELAERRKEVTSCRTDMDRLSKKLQMYEENLCMVKEDTGVAESQKESYENLLRQKDLEIENLRLKVNCQFTIQTYKDEVKQEVMDLEARIKSKRKEEKVAEISKEEDVQRGLNEIRDMIKRKASQSEVDRLNGRLDATLKNITPNITTSNNNVREEPVNIGFDSNNPGEDGRQTRRINDGGKDGNKEELPRKRNFNRDDPGSHSVYNNEEIVLIMDSNMNYIEEKKFWRSTFKLKCGRADMLENKIKGYDLSNATHIFVGTGTNDVEQGDDAETIFERLRSTAVYLSSTYEANVYLAQLPPTTMDGGRSEVVRELNSMIKQCNINNINIILHENLTTNDLFDQKHVRINSLKKFVKNMKDEMRNVLGQSTNEDQNMLRKQSPQINNSQQLPPRPPSNRYYQRENSDNDHNDSTLNPTHRGKISGHNVLAELLKNVQLSNQNLINGLTSLSSFF